MDVEISLNKEKKIYLFEILTIYFDIVINLNEEKNLFEINYYLPRSN